MTDMFKSTKKPEGKPRLGLIDPHFVEGIGKVLTYGESKHGTLTFRKGGIALEYIDALLRHINKFQQGEDCDKESGLPHLHHAATNLMILDYLFRNNKGDLSL